MKNTTFGTTVRLFLMAAFIFSMVVGMVQTVRAAGTQLPVDLGAADSFAILTKTGITNVPTSAITGDMGVSPIAATGITGFSLIADSTNVFSTSSQVTGKIYAANYAPPTPSNLTTAISNMEAAYNDAAGRSIPDFTELYTGDLSGQTLVPGLYKWSTGVLITSDVTLAGSATDVWIFQIAQNLTMTSGAQVLLSGGAQAKNIFWQVAGGVGVEIGTTAHMEGNILAKKAIHLRTGASLNGRALSQTAVTLAKNVVVIPSFDAMSVFTSDPTNDGWVLEFDENSGKGGSLNAFASSINVGDDASNKQYVGILHFDTSSLPDDAVITKATLKLLDQEVVGTNPFGTHMALKADIREPFFGLNAKLQVSDFQRVASFNSAAKFGSTPLANWYSAALNTTGRSFISRTGTTQFRVRFVLDDNNNSSADYVKFFSGNAYAEKNRPQLIIRYYVP